MKQSRGRKKIDEKLRRIPVTIFLEQYKIDELGGLEEVKEKLAETIRVKLIINEIKIDNDTSILSA